MGGKGDEAPATALRHANIAAAFDPTTLSAITDTIAKADQL
jgi:hypothetical protein